MALERQTISIPFGGGIEGKQDPKQIKPGKLLDLQNATFESPGQLKKRHGFTKLATAASVTEDFTAASATCVTFGEQLLRVVAGDVEPYSEANNAFYPTSGQVSLCSLSISAAATAGAASNEGVMCRDMACLDGVYLYAWESTDGGVYYRMVDAETGVEVVATTLLNASYSQVKTMSLGGRFVLYVKDASNYLCYYSLVPDGTISGETTVSSAALAESYDVCSQTVDVAGADVERLYAVYAIDGTTNKLYARYLSEGTGTGAPTQGSEANFSLDAPTNGVACFPAGTGVGVASERSGNLKYVELLADLSSTAHAAVTMEGSLLSGGVFQVTGYSTASGTCVLYYTVSAGGDATSVRKAYVVSWGTPSAGAVYSYNSTFNIHYCLAGKIVGAEEMGAVVPIAYRTDESESFYLVRAATGSLYAKIANTSLFDYYPVPETVLVATGKYALLCPLTTESEVTPLKMATFDTTVAPSFAELDASLCASGGLCKMYDGARVVENGFSETPVTPTVSSGGGGSGHIYQYVQVWSWVDHQGVTHRSETSLPVTVETTDPISGTDKVVMDAHLCTMTDKTGVVTEFYRTEDGLTTFYFVGSTSSATYEDGSTDSDIASNASLYTTGGVLDNMPTTPLGAMTVFDGRVWAVDSLNPTQLYYSKERRAGYPVEWAYEFTKDAPGEGGAIGALAALDGKLIIFKQSRIYALAGQGPDVTGVGSTYSAPEMLPFAVGCSNPRSVVTTPDGLLFQSQKGFWLLDRSLSAHYVGAPVEEFNSETVVSAVALPTNNQVRFVLESGEQLVWDWLVKQWSRFTHTTDPTYAGGCIWDSSQVLINSYGLVTKESTSGYVDATPTGSGTEGYSMSATTGWIRLTDLMNNVAPRALAGYQRVRRVVVLGEWRSAHTLTCRVYHGYVDAASQTETCTSSAAIYPYKVRVDFGTQKSEAFKLQLSTSAGTGEEVSLSGLTIDLGVKKGTSKVPSSQIV